MSAEPKWISKKALVLLHEESLAEFGGARGARRRTSGFWVVAASEHPRSQARQRYRRSCRRLRFRSREKPCLRGREQARRFSLTWLVSCDQRSFVQRRPDRRYQLHAGASERRSG